MADPTASAAPGGGPGSPRFAGRHVAVTGAGTGIGRAIAERLSAEGARLSLFGRRIELLEQTAEQLVVAGGTRPFVQTLDIRDPAAVESAFGKAADECGGFYALVANAGIGGPNQPGADDRFADIVATNLSGSYHCARSAQRHLLEGDGVRHLVFLSSILGRISVPGYSGYCASKAALLGLARALAAELAPERVQVNAVCPGWVDTQMARDGLADMADAMGISPEQAHSVAMEAVPLGRMGQPREVAGMIAWLLSEDALGVTGQGLDMNGGAFMT